MLIIDGVEWTIPCDISRTSEIRASEISGQMMDGSWFNDPLGTFMRYEVTLAPNPRDMAAYYAVYEILTAPVDGHVFVLPYNGDTIEITARVESVADVYVRMAGGEVYWKGVRFTITANHPSKTEALGEVIQRGRTPMPDVSGPEVGDTYTWTGTTWQKVEGD